jgi:hypothetical protein
MKESTSSISNDEINSKNHLKYIIKTIGEALNIDHTNKMLVQTSEVLFNAAYLQYKNNSNKRNKEELDLIIESYLELFRNMLSMRKQLENINNCKFRQIEKICQDLVFGEIIIKVQNGNPVLIESLKKQIKLI